MRFNEHKVRIRHHRVIRQHGAGIFLMPVTKQNKHKIHEVNAEIRCKGGMTEAIFDHPEGGTVVTSVRCDSRDNYTKRIGRKMALERLFAKYPEYFKGCTPR
jgi:hypothetical protein